MKKISLKIRIVSAMVIIFLVSVGVILPFAVKHSEKILTEVMLEQLVNETQQVARQAEIILEDGGSTQELQNFVNDVASPGSHYAYAVVIDKTVTAIAHSDEEKINKTYLDDTTYTVPAAQQGEIMTSKFWADVQQTWTYDVMYPIYVDGELFASMDVGIYSTVVDDVLSRLGGTISVAVVFLLIIICVASLVIMQLLFKVFEYLIRFCDELSNGNLSTQIDDKIVHRKDEVGNIVKAMINMRDSLKEVILTTNDNSIKVSEISEQLAATAQDTHNKAAEIVTKSQKVSSHTLKQSELTKQNNQMIEEISEGMEHIAASIQNVTDESSHTASEAEEGNKQLTVVVSQMNLISEKVENTYQKIQKLSEMSGTIENVVNLIAEISNQTNLLSLNASIEAARAGEQGRGFAVVAGEVGKLAEESRVATQNITDIIHEIQEAINEAVSLMDEGNISVQHGIELASKAQESFKVIQNSIDTVSNDMESVAAVTQQVTANTLNLCTSVEKISTLADTVDESVQEVSDAALIQEGLMNEISSSVFVLKELSTNLQRSFEAFHL